GSIIVTLSVHQALFLLFIRCFFSNSVNMLTASVFYLLGVMASLYFKMCIALERYFFIACPLLDFIRKTKTSVLSSVLLCVLVWAFCIVSFPLAIVLHQFIHLLIYAALPGPLFIFCLARTFRALPAATSVPTQEKRRSLGILILLFFKYFVLILIPISIFHNERIPFEINWIFFLLCPFVDLVLCLFMRQGRIDRLLACLCSSVTSTL
uniref:G-protein coupled receptors family 1 profile domain-containing protein n=1 Tax=Maylandia zebra TaxID=106582 RepID=A0A3P9DQK7_9CICH